MSVKTSALLMEASFQLQIPLDRLRDVP